MEGAREGREKEKKEGGREGAGCLNHVALSIPEVSKSSNMSAPDEDTFAEEGVQMEEMDEAGSDDDEGVDMEEEGEDGNAEKKVYVPGIEPLQPGEELEMDRSAYRMYHECQTGKLEPLKLAHEDTYFCQYTVSAVSI